MKNKKANAKILALLTEKEFTYLKNICKPFQNRVDWVLVVRNTLLDDQEDNVRIRIRLAGNDYIILPFFKEGTMYKGLIPNMAYSLKDLGITYE